MAGLLKCSSQNICVIYLKNDPIQAWYHNLLTRYEQNTSTSTISHAATLIVLINR